MTWAEQLVRIRRFLRDPNGNIWSDAQLLRLYNAEQDQLYRALGFIESAWAACLPPRFFMSYTHDWEWAFSDHADGAVYLLSEYYDADDYVFVYIWEAEHLGGGTCTTSDTGEQFCHPWEAYMVSVPGKIPPSLMPVDFDDIWYVAWQKRPLDPMTKREMQRQDPSHIVRAGTPFAYWRDEKLSDRVYLYPIPSGFTWYDCSTDYSLVWPTGSMSGTEQSDSATETLTYTVAAAANDGRLRREVDGANPVVYDWSASPTFYLTGTESLGLT